MKISFYLIMLLSVISSNKICAQETDWAAYYTKKLREYDSLYRVEEAENRMHYSMQKLYEGSVYLGSKNMGIQIGVSDNHIFVYMNNKLHCYNAKSKTLKWKKTYEHYVTKSFNFTKDHIILFGFDKILRAINKNDGSLYWQNDSSKLVYQYRNNPNTSSPFVHSDGQDYLINNETALPDSLNLPFSYTRLSMYKGNIISILRGEVLSSEIDDTVRYYNPTKKKTLWTDVYSTPSVYPIENRLLIRDSMRDTLIVVNSKNGKICYSESDSVPCHRFIATDAGCVKLTSRYCKIINFKKPQRNLTIESESDDGRFAIPRDRLLYSNGKFYLPTHSGKIKCYDTKKGKLLWEFDARCKISSNLVEEDGILYFGTTLGTLVALDVNKKIKQK
ncbi:PQQ-binding-like beta-propeller repeat protein [Saccharicrinis aurantiacus]|uniref:outer membrane protein assembly factor BamB family protein n=1 Tax=Saccharicrinis aurantiacus TaxID=1849719 RepID=UPI00248FAD8A|nr:PQQ-binding-like beta-propeller repeat protein [Saccharicrinis aurantiacus]